MRESPVARSPRHAQERKASTCVCANFFERPDVLLRLAHQLSVKLFAEECGALGLTPAQFTVLTVVAEIPGINQTGLAVAAGHDKVTINHVVRGLEERGLLQRRSAAPKTREVHLSLTHAGRTMLRSSEGPTTRVAERVLQPLSETQRKRLAALLKFLNLSLADKARAAWANPASSH